MDFVSFEINALILCNGHLWCTFKMSMKLFTNTIEKLFLVAYVWKINTLIKIAFLSLPMLDKIST